MEGATGVGAPLGWLGGELVFVPLRSVVLHAGAGLGSQGVQVSAGARYRFALRARNSVDVGASWSSGAYAGVPSSVPPLPEMGVQHPVTFYWDRAHFANLDLSYEHDFGGVILRPFLGVGYVLNGNDAIVTNLPCYSGSESCSKTLARIVPFFGLSLAFGVL